MSLPQRIALALPPWVAAEIDAEACYPSDEAKLELALQLARRNVEAGSGGPFGAAIFDAEGRLVAAGVNRVVPEHCSLAHAETMAYMLAQQRLGRFRLNQDGRAYTLASSAQPCCQCYGATLWAGIDRLLFAASGADVEALTPFDEGPLPADWEAQLTQRGITVRQGLLRDEARTILATYGHRGSRY